MYLISAAVLKPSGRCVGSSCQIIGEYCDKWVTYVYNRKRKFLKCLGCYTEMFITVQ